MTESSGLRSNNTKEVASDWQHLMRQDACCLRCEYLLRGLAEPRCPECGEAFDPQDPSTYGPRQPGRRTLPLHQRHPHGPPIYSWLPLVVIAYAVLLGATEICSEPFAAITSSGIAATLFVCTVYYLESLAAAVARRIVMSPKERHDLLRVPWWRWFVGPASAAFLILGVLGNRPMSIRFLCSRPAFNRTVSDILAGKAVPCPSRIGLYNVYLITSRDDGIWFTTHATSADQHGFHLAQDGPGGPGKARSYWSVY